MEYYVEELPDRDGYICVCLRVGGKGTQFGAVVLLIREDSKARARAGFLNPHTGDILGQSIILSLGELPCVL